MSVNYADFAHQLRMRVYDYWREKEIREGRLVISPEFREWLDACRWQHLSKTPSSELEKMKLPFEHQ